MSGDTKNEFLIHGRVRLRTGSISTGEPDAVADDCARIDAVMGPHLPDDSIEIAFTQDGSLSIRARGRSIDIQPRSDNQIFVRLRDQ